MLLKKFKTLFLFLFISLASSFQLKAESIRTAYFAGGCFWCVEADLEKIPGIISVVSGYLGGKKNTANYENVSSGATKHIEAVEVTFNPKKISYKKMLNSFWKMIDPTVKNRQFCDKGYQYQSAIYYKGPKQKKLIYKSLNEMKKKYKIKDIHTKIINRENLAFYKAEEYHQDYYKKNPIRYKLYRLGCGRDKRLKEVWKMKKGSKATQKK